jgi:hypothetical protein
MCSCAWCDIVGQMPICFSCQTMALKQNSSPDDLCDECKTKMKRYCCYCFGFYDTEEEASLVEGVCAWCRKVEQEENKTKKQIEIPYY